MWNPLTSVLVIRSFSDEAIQCIIQRSTRSWVPNFVGPLSKPIGTCEGRRREGDSTIFNGEVTLLPFKRVWDYKGQCQHVGPLLPEALGVKQCRV